MDGSNHPSKRRRLDHSYNNHDSPMDSSSADELAAGSDHDEAERRRASWNMQKKAYTPKRAYPRPSELSESESPDELALDADEYWRRSSRNQRPPRIRARRSQDARSDTNIKEEEQESQESQDDVNDADEEDDEMEHEPAEVEEEEEEEAEPVVQRTITPMPPPPPPKPERVNYREKFLLKGHLRGVSAVQFSPDGSMIASGGADGAVKVWDTLTGKLIHTFEGHLAGISTISWGPDGATIASGSDDKSIRLWNVLTGKAHPVPFIGHHNYVYQIAFSPKGNILASGSYDEAVFLWDVRSAQVMKSLPAHSDPVAGIDVVRDGTLVVSCALDGLIRIWDTATGQCLRTLVHEDNPPVTAVKFSPNGKFVLAWTLDDCVRLWNYVEGRCVKTYQGHANRKYSISGSFGVYGVPGGPPEAFAVSGSEDGSVLCWDVVSKKILQRLEGHTDVVLGVDTCSFEGKRYMVSCGLDQTVRLWEEVDEEGEQKPGPEAGGEESNNHAQQADPTPMTTDHEPEANTNAVTNNVSESDSANQSNPATDPSGDVMME